MAMAGGEHQAIVSGNNEILMKEPLMSEGMPSSSSGNKMRKSKLLTVCPYILANEFCERLAYYGIATNLVGTLMTP
jgi:hypothetical protein